MINEENLKPKNLVYFSLLIITQMLSSIGSEVSALAVSIWVLDETGQVMPLALVSFFGILPSILASQFSGFITDRLKKQYVIAIADTGQAITTVLLFVSFFSGNFQLWHLYTVVFVRSLFAILQGPAFNVSITMLIPDEYRDRANAIMQITGPTGGIISPAIAGIIYVLGGVEGAILVDLMTFIIAVIIILFIEIPQPKESNFGRKMKSSISKEIFAGFVFLWSRKALLTLVISFSIFNFLLTGVGVLKVPYLLARTGSETQLGLLLSVISAGLVAGGFAMAAWGGTRLRIHTIMPGLILSGIFAICFGLSTSIYLLYIFAFFLFFPSPFMNAAIVSLIQSIVPPDLQGRVFSVIQQIAFILKPAAYLLAGYLADTFLQSGINIDTFQFLESFWRFTEESRIGILISICGFLTLLVGAFVYSIPTIREIETNEVKVMVT